MEEPVSLDLELDEEDVEPEWRVVEVESSWLGSRSLRPVRRVWRSRPSDPNPFPRLRLFRWLPWR